MHSITHRGLAALSLALISASALTPAMAQEAETVQVGLLSLTSHSPSIIAEAKGYFEDEGLDVEFVSFQAAQPMAVAIASGDVDFGVTAISASLITLAGHGVIKVIGGALQEAEGIEGQKILVSNDAYEAGLTTPADLPGHRFGITTAGSSFHYMAHKIADGEGFERSEIQLVPLNSVPAVIASLRSGQIDAWSIVPNIAIGLSKSGDVHVIGEVADYVDGYQVTTVFTSTDIAENQPEVAQSFIDAFSKGIADYNAALVDKTMSEEDTAEIVAMIHEYVYTDRPIEDADPAIRAGAMRMSPNASLNLASIADQLEWFKSEDLVPDEASLENLVDTSFVETTE